MHPRLHLKCDRFGTACLGCGLKLHPSRNFCLREASQLSEGMLQGMSYLLAQKGVGIGQPAQLKTNMCTRPRCKHFTRLYSRLYSHKVPREGTLTVCNFREKKGTERLGQLPHVTKPRVIIQTLTAWLQNPHSFTATHGPRIDSEGHHCTWLEESAL